MQVLLNEPVVQYQSTGSSVVFPSSLANDVGYSTLFGNTRYFSDQIAAILQQLAKIAALGNNWDSYGAASPGEVSILKAHQFVVENRNTLLPFFFVAPGVNGEVMLEFNTGQKSAELYFNPDGSNELLLYSDDNILLEGTLEEHFFELMDFFDE